MAPKRHMTPPTPSFHGVSILPMGGLVELVSFRRDDGVVVANGAVVVVVVVGGVEVEWVVLG